MSHLRRAITLFLSSGGMSKPPCSALVTGRVGSRPRTKSACFFAQAAPSDLPVASGISLPMDQAYTQGWLRSRFTMLSVSNCHHLAKKRW